MRCVVLDLCAICFLIFRVGSASSYQWRCSALDTTNNKYYLPDFGGRTQALGYTWQSSHSSVTYVYEVDENELNCSGTVTAVEFCYTKPPNDNREVFTLLVLTQRGKSITVTKSIPISFHPISDQCVSSKCCDVMILTEQNQFNLPSPNFSLGITIKHSPNLPGLFFGNYPRFQTQSSYQLTEGQPVVNNVFTLNEAIQQSLRLMWLHITPSSITTSSVQQSSSSIITETTATEPSLDNVFSNKLLNSSHLTEATVSFSSDRREHVESAGNSNTSAVGAVIGAVVVLITIIIVVLLVLVMLIQYRRKKYHLSKNTKPTSIIDNSIFNNLRTTSTVAMKDSALKNPEYDYSEVGPTACVKGPTSTKQEELQVIRESILDNPEVAMA